MNMVGFGKLPRHLESVNALHPSSAVLGSCRGSHAKCMIYAHYAIWKTSKSALSCATKLS